MQNTLRFQWNLLTVKENSTSVKASLMKCENYVWQMVKSGRPESCSALLWEFWNNCRSYILIFRFTWIYHTPKTESFLVTLFFSYLRSSEKEIHGQKVKVRTDWSIHWRQLWHSCSKLMIPKQKLDLPYEGIMLKEDKIICPAKYGKT